MKSSATRLALSALLACAVGCYSFEAAPADARHPATRPAGAPVEHVVVANNGWFLFDSWPLACGNANAADGSRWRFFRNDVDIDILHGHLTRYAAARGCDVRELNVFNDEQVLLSIPGLSVPLFIPYIITFREMQISGVLVKRAPRTGGAQ